MPDSMLALRRQPRDSLATKIIFFVFFSTFITALVVSWISVHSTYAFLRTHLDGSYPLLLDRSSQRLETWVSEGQDRLAQVALDRDLVRSSTGARDAREAADAALETALVSGKSFAGFVVTDQRDAAVAAASAAGLPPHVARQLHGAPEAQLDAVAGQLVASTPIRDASGARVGTLHGIFAAETSAAHLAETHVPEDAQLYLVDRTGHVLATSAPAESMRFDAFPPGIDAAVLVPEE